MDGNEVLYAHNYQTISRMRFNKARLPGLRTCAFGFMNDSFDSVLETEHLCIISPQSLSQTGRDLPWAQAYENNQGC